MSGHKEDAQSDLRRVLELLWFVGFFLEQAKDRLPYASNAEAMGNGEVPQTLSFALRGSIECAMSDHVDPLEDLLREAIRETPESLIRDWRKRQKGRK